MWIFFCTFAARIIVRIHIRYAHIRKRAQDAHSTKTKAMPNMQLQKLPIGEQSFFSDLNNLRDISRERQDGSISESGMKNGMKSGMSSESGMPNDKWPKSWPKKWPNHAEMILEAIAHDTTITVLELENQLPIGHSTIAKLLVALQTEGYLDRVKDNTGTHWQILENK